MVLAHHRPVRRDDRHFQTVDLLELVGFGIGGAGHAGQLLVQAEVVLEGNRRQRVILALDRHAFLGLDRLVQAVRPASSGERAAGELVDDDDLAVAHDVVDIALVEIVRAQRGIQMVHDHDVVRVIQAVIGTDDGGRAHQRFRMLHAGFGQMHLLALLVDPEVAFAFLVLLSR